MNKLLRIITHSMAFWPSIISFGFLVLAISVLYVDSLIDLNEYVPVLIVSQEESIRTILGAMLGGMITLVVFSFTMMMTLYSQASTNYSPRLVSNFTERKSYQIILGYYIGLIVFIIVVLYNVGSIKDANPELATVFATVLGIGALGVFVYFLNSVSRSMLVTSMVYDEYAFGMRNIEQLETDGSSLQNNMILCEHEIRDVRMGYEYDIDLEDLADLCDEFDLVIEVYPSGVYYYSDGPVVARTNRQVSNEEKEKILDCFSFHVPAREARSFGLSMRRIQEVAVRALSPSVNDPGTAALCMDYLTELFVARSEKSAYEFCEQNHRVRVQHTDFGDLLRLLIGHLYQYGKEDRDIRIKFGHFFEMLKQEGSGDVRKLVVEYQKELLGT